MKRTYSEREAQEHASDQEEASAEAFLHFSREEIEKSGRKYVNLPKKSLHRMHAHINPFNPLYEKHPLNHRFVDWSQHYPHAFGLKPDETQIVCNTKKYPIKNAYADLIESHKPLQPTILDVGCGYGGLLFQLTRTFPEKLILGMEIRDKLVNYVAEKINSARSNSNQALCSNTAVICCNAMKTFTNYFKKDSVSAVVFVTLSRFRSRRFSSASPTLTSRNRTIGAGSSTLHCCQTTPT